MTDFVANASQFIPADVQPWLQQVRERAGAQWRDNTMPSRKTEHWKYLSLRPLSKARYFARASLKPGLANNALHMCYDIPDLNGITLVFVNGQYSAELSQLDLLPEGASIERFCDMQESSSGSALLNSVVETNKHLFSQLNTSHIEDGIFLQIGKNVALTAPIHLVNVVTTQPQPFSVVPRLFVHAHANSEATVVEHFCSSEEQQNCFINSITELAVEDGARLNYFRLQLEQENALHIGGVHASIGRSGKLDAFHVSLGSELQRLDFTVTYKGEGGEANLNGVYLPRGNQQVDCHTCVEHAVPHCTTSEVFRGIVSDSAKAVFNGRIHIHPDAQKTLAQLSNKNLLTSNKAEVDTKPELEIYADDVQCAHGATVAQVDDTALHYLMTRGVSREEAQVMLSFGFINELIGKIKLEAIVNYLRPVLARRFAKNAELTRHIL